MDPKSPELAALIEKLKSDHTPLKDSTQIHEDWSVIFSSKHYVLIIKTDPPLDPPGTPPPTKPKANFEIKGKHFTEENTVADVVKALKL